ncbi:DUF4065 domain-containing protein [Devosia algicola]|uniref:DUF4065 domain-containing protein n=1 Tax=Devosia algicola TaxID=3026418 RepID=A0ABY7YRU0_9HYPH|nr:type II toxin-antitoxin system antitoxin SocA domain-containing protein [Devosia algicola]WDR04056.1 DUF4065 domain-containing protein [Devosia algicola]
MTIRLDTAARFLCEQSGWSISNLQLQKLLYLAQVEHAARCNGAELVGDKFQAWDYGPVIPKLYGRLKMFGAGRVEDVFRDALTLKQESDSHESLATVWSDFGDVAPGELIEVTHWDRGGWAQRYEPGIRSIPIRQTDIIEEARNRSEYADEWRSVIAA